MKLKEFDILLDIKRSKKAEEFEVVQNDFETNILNITVVDGLETFPLSGLDIEIAFAKPDGTTVLQDLNNGVEIIGDKVVCTLKTNTIAAHGRVQAEVRFLEGTKLLTSARFSFFVRRSIVNDDTIESTNEFPILNQLINTTQDLIDQVGQIEQQVPENVVTQLNEVSDLANQLQVDLGAHKADNVQLKEIHGLRIEQGTWTPKVEGTTVAGVNTYQQQTGVYYKIGKFVWADCVVWISTKDVAMSGPLKITGLPFAALGRNISANIGTIEGFTKPADAQITAFFNINEIRLRKNNGGPSGYLGASEINDGFYVLITGIYQTN